MPREVAEKYLFGFDTETGSLEPEEADLLTLYGCIINEEFQIVDELNLKLKPEGRLPVAHAEALAINKIDIKAHLADPTTVTYEEGKAQLTTMLKKYVKKVGKGTNIRPFGYNVNFDVNWTKYHLLPKDEWKSLLHYKIVDVMQDIDFLKDCGWFPADLGSLGSVVDYLQLPKRNAHDAKEDLLMTIDVYKKVLDLMRSKKDGGQVQDLISLLEAE